eukprot:scaffold1327_cov124-Cylindrotheca_fusiformis.AAC.1
MYNPRVLISEPSRHENDSDEYSNVSLESDESSSPSNPYNVTAGGSRPAILHSSEDQESFYDDDDDEDNGALIRNSSRSFSTDSTYHSDVLTSSYYTSGGSFEEISLSTENSSQFSAPSSSQQQQQHRAVESLLTSFDVESEDDWMEDSPELVISALNDPLLLQEQPHDLHSPQETSKNGMNGEEQNQQQPTQQLGEKETTTEITAAASSDSHNESNSIGNKEKKEIDESSGAAGVEVIDDESNPNGWFLTTSELKELDVLLECASQDHQDEEYDKDRLYELSLVYRGSCGAPLDADEKLDLDYFRLVRQRDWNYQQELARLFQQREDGQTIDDHRLYCLQLYERRNNGEELEDDEYEQLEEFEKAEGIVDEDDNDDDLPAPTSNAESEFKVEPNSLILPRSSVDLEAGGTGSGQEEPIGSDGSIAGSIDQEDKRHFDRTFINDASPAPVSNSDRSYRSVGEAPGASSKDGDMSSSCSSASGVAADRTLEQKNKANNLDERITGDVVSHGRPVDGNSLAGSVPRPRSDSDTSEVSSGSSTTSSDSTPVVLSDQGQGARDQAISSQYRSDNTLGDVSPLQASSPESSSSSDESSEESSGEKVQTEQTSQDMNLDQGLAKRTLSPQISDLMPGQQSVRRDANVSTRSIDQEDEHHVDPNVDEPAFHAPTSFNESSGSVGKAPVVAPKADNISSSDSSTSADAADSTLEEKNQANDEDETTGGYAVSHGHAVDGNSLAASLPSPCPDSDSSEVSSGSTTTTTSDSTPVGLPDQRQGANKFVAHDLSEAISSQHRSGNTLGEVNALQASPESSSSSDESSEESSDSEVQIEQTNEGMEFDKGSAKTILSPQSSADSMPGQQPVRQDAAVPRSIDEAIEHHIDPNVDQAAFYTPSSFNESSGCVGKAPVVSSKADNISSSHSSTSKDESDIALEEKKQGNGGDKGTGGHLAILGGTVDDNSRASSVPTSGSDVSSGSASTSDSPRFDDLQIANKSNADDHSEGVSAYYGSSNSSSESSTSSDDQFSREIKDDVLAKQECKEELLLDQASIKTTTIKDGNHDDLCVLHASDESSSGGDASSE